MKLSILLCTSAILALGGSLPAQAQSLLGGLLGGGDTELITLGPGDAGSSGLVNAGVGGNQVLDANIGGGSVADASVGSGGGSTLSADVGLLNNTATLGLGVGGNDLLDVDVGIGGGGGSGGNGGNGANGGNGGGVGSGGGLFASASGVGAANCAGISARELERLILATRIDSSWERATNVDVRRIEVCPELRASLAAALRQTGLNNSLRSAIARDALVAATLDRSPYRADRVFAVRQSGRNLVVFVY